MTSRFTQTTLILLVALTPLFFSTLTPNFYSTPKLFLLLLGTAVLAGHYIYSIVKNNSLLLPRSPLVFPLVIFLLGLVTNLVFIPLGRPDALLGNGSLLISLSILSLYLLTVSDRKLLLHRIHQVVIFVGSLLAIHSLISLTLYSRLTFLPTFMQIQAFTPTGSYLTTLILIILSTILSLTLFSQTAKSRRPLYLGTAILGVISCVAITALMLPGSPLSPILLPYKESWAIALDSMKSAKSLLIGVGLGNYPALFNAVKPLSLNLGTFWNLQPGGSTSELLNLLSTTGLLVTLPFIWLLAQGFNKQEGSKSIISPVLLALSLALILMPGSIPLYLLFFVIVVLSSKEISPTVVHLSSQKSLIIAALGSLITLTLVVFSFRPFISEFFMRKAAVALAAEDGKSVYDYHRQAINFYPRRAVYHLSFAEVNLGLASALSQKSDLSDQDRETVATLISQAIQEGKTAINLHPQYSANWVSLAKIYRNLINVAEGADKFALDYYAQAVSLDPANPSLRVDFGGLLVQLKDYAGAVSQFQTAIQLKPDYANAYYNLAKVLESQNDFTNAYQVMQKAVASLSPDSPDLSRATSELETLKGKLPKATPTPSPSGNSGSDTSELSQPSPLPSPITGGPIEIPEDSPVPTPSPEL